MSELSNRGPRPAPILAPLTEPASWRDRFTLLRMLVAFFFPWPFLTKNLELSAERRAMRRDHQKGQKSRLTTDMSRGEADQRS